MKLEELSASQAHFTYDIDRISRLRQNAGKVGIMGQPRAMSALMMGMNVNTKGYNIYISGEDGTGRHSAVREIAASLKTERPVPDMVYAYNFRRPQSPFLISLPSPSGSVLHEGMETIASLVSDGQWEKAGQIVSELKKNLPASVLLDQFLLQVKEALEGDIPEADKYRVNLVCDNSGLKRCPLVEEYHPTHTNLFGQMTSSSEFAHLRLTSGSLLDAAGGFFVVRADKILSQEGLWESLKLYAESSSFIVRGQNDKNSTFIRPVTSSVATKIILIGSDELYDKLCDSDDEFLRLFKVSAEFDFSMPATDENIQGTIAYLLDITAKNTQIPISDSAICQLLVYSSWYAEMRDELTTKLSFLGNLVSEANYVAERENHREIDAYCINRAMEERDFANSLTEDKINQEIQSG